jgi:hypothetical protein
LGRKRTRIVSFIRSSVFTVVFLYGTYLVFWPFKVLNVFMLILVLFWGLSFSISYLYLSKRDSNILLIEMKNERNRWLNETNHFEILQYVKKLIWQEVNAGEFARVIKILTLPFNINIWRKRIKKFYSLFTTLNTHV